MVEVWIARYEGPRPPSWDSNPGFAALQSRIGQTAPLHEALDIARGFNSGELARGIGLWAFVFAEGSGARFGRSVVDGTLPAEA